MSRRHAAHPAVSWWTARRRRAHVHHRARPLHLVPGVLPHHPGAVLRVVELLDEAGDVLLVAPGENGVHHRLHQRQVLDALRRPVRLNLRRRHPPHLLGVRLEEDAVQAPAEARRRPPLERGLVPGWTEARPEVREEAARRLDETQSLERVEGAQRIVEHGAAVVDAAHPRSQQEVLLAEDVQPQPLDRRHLGEEAVAADVEAPAVTLDGAGDAADHVVGLQRRRRDGAAAQGVGGGEPGGPGADDDDVGIPGAHGALPFECASVVMPMRDEINAAPSIARVATLTTASHSRQPPVGVHCAYRMNHTGPEIPTA